MAPLTVEDQFKFLIACIKHSTAGKIDFGQVATECEIISKGAAAKRYERLMKSHGINGNGGGGGGGNGSPGPPTGGAAATTTPKGKTGGKARTPASKKRKLVASTEDVDEDIKPEIKSEPFTAEPKNRAKAEAKAKVDDELSSPDNSSDGSYNIHPFSITPDMVTAVAATAPTTALARNPYLALAAIPDYDCGHNHSHSHSHSHYGSSSAPDEDILTSSEGQRAFQGPNPAVSLPFIHQMLMCHPSETCYGLVDRFSGDLMTPAARNALRPLSAAVLLDGHDGYDHVKHEHGRGINADFIPSQTTMPFEHEHATGHWFPEQHASVS
ncbi:hypothetical protein BD289DRAFT_506768 [Coniella lustricola]|uniref:Myb-like DNA-binding domain-containing protein n=1 Tax=Coniella lustricola TaxID=2025994 RepID=A0A2T3A5B2_9PEZI|nr:hypothetical protein BD289DRAFT_506768 [Coniella lustricola]